jgi:hypothetical protein
LAGPYQSTCSGEAAGGPRCWRTNHEQCWPSIHVRLCLHDRSLCVSSVAPRAAAGCVVYRPVVCDISVAIKSVTVRCGIPCYKNRDTRNVSRSDVEADIKQTN